MTDAEVKGHEHHSEPTTHVSDGLKQNECEHWVNTGIGLRKTIMNWANNFHLVCWLNYPGIGLFALPMIIKHSQMDPAGFSVLWIVGWFSVWSYDIPWIVFLVMFRVYFPWDTFPCCSDRHHVFVKSFQLWQKGSSADSGPLLCFQPCIHRHPQTPGSTLGSIIPSYVWKTG